MTGKPQELHSDLTAGEPPEIKPVDQPDGSSGELVETSAPAVSSESSDTEGSVHTEAPAAASVPQAAPPALPNPEPPPLAPVESAAPAVAETAAEPPAVDPVPPVAATAEPTVPPTAAAVEPTVPPVPAVPADPSMLPGLPQAPVDGAAEDDDLEDVPLEALLGEYAPEPVELHEGDRRDGIVVSVSEDGVVVDIGGKTEGFLSARSAPEGSLAELNTGDSVSVYVNHIGEPGEYIRLGLAREENTEAWDALEEAYRNKETVVAKVIERVKGGLTADVGVPAFLPGSQVSTNAAEDLDALVGQEFPVAIVKMSRRRGNVVVSRRRLMEDVLNERKRETLEKLELGAEVTGQVKNVTAYGAFVDLGGLDGLIHVTDISYGRIKDPSDALTPGQEVTAKVIKFDREKERVSLSLKDMKPDPWATVAERYNTGDRVKGTVAGVTDYGAFVELEEGVEGLIHISEMTWSKRLRHPAKLLTEGQELEAAVLKVQPTQRRVSLSLRALRPDPWDNIEGTYQMGSIVEGRVRNVTAYGAFVEVEEGVDGLVHVSDLSWDSRPRNPKDLVKKGQTIRAVVLSVDSENRRLSLGVKQLEPDVWERFFSLHGVGDVLPGQVTRLAKFGAFVELAPGVEGLCHNSEMPAKGKGRKSGLQVGERYEFEILRMDEFEKRIGLRGVSGDPIPEGEAPESEDAAPE